MRKLRKLLLSVLFVVFALASTFGFVACGDKESSTATNEVKLAFNDNLQTSYVIGSLVDLETSVDMPEFQTFSMKAEYELDGKKKTYLCVGLSFKPTNAGEVTVTVTCGKDKISTKILVVEPEPTVGTMTALEYEIGDVVAVSELEASVTIIPLGTPVSVTKVRYAAGEEQDLTSENYTFERIGEYEFFYTATNTSGSVDGWFSVNVVREVTAVEKDDLTNSIKQMDISTVTQVDDGNEESDWSWKVAADPYGVYANGENFNYWLSRVYFDFGRIIDLSEEYIEMDVWASENTYEGGVLIYFSPSLPSQFEWHVCPGTVYNSWTTISTADTSIRTNEEKTKTGARGIIVTVLHKQVGEYNPEEVYMLFDNLRVCKYPVIGEYEQEDATNNGSKGTSQGVSFRRYVDKQDNPIDKAAESDWSYKLSCKTEYQTSDYPYADVYFSTDSTNYSLEDYSFSFFVKGNDAYYHEKFYYSVLYFDDGNLAVNGPWQYSYAMEAGSWNYVSSVKSGAETGLVAGIRFWLNTYTTDVRDAELYVDNMRLHVKSNAEKYDFSNNITVNERNDVTYAMTTMDTATKESGWAWKINGAHFDYFKITFDKSYAFSNYVFSFDMKAVSNFGGKIVAQLVAEDGSVKKDVMFEGDASEWKHFDTSKDNSLLAVYKAVNLYLLAEDPTKPVELLLDNVCLTSRGNTEYVAISADDWETKENTDGSTTYTLQSFSKGETYLQLVKEGGYTNEFISVRTKLNGTKNAGLVLGARIPTATMTSNSKAYGKEGFYLVLNDGFFTLYGPTYHGTHCGSYNYIPAPQADTEYELRFGVIYNNNNFKALFYIYNLDGTLHSSYEWTNLGYVTPDKLWANNNLAGSFMVWSWYDAERSWTISEPYGYIDAPKPTAEGNTIKFNAPYADKFLVSTDGGKSWTDNTTGTYTMPSYGVYTISVKSVLGTVESEATTITLVYAEDDIAVANMKDVTFTTLNHEKGAITYTSTTEVTTRKAATLTLKNAYADQLIKVGFKAKATSVYGNQLTIGFRQTLVNVDPLVQWSTGHGQFGNGINIQHNGNYPLVYTSTYIPAAQGGLGTTLTYDPTFNPASNFVVGNQYYYVAGVIGKGEAAQFVFGILDENDTPLHIAKWNWSDIKAKYAHAGAVADTGYFAILDWATGETRSLTYELIEDSAAFIKAYERMLTLKTDGNTVEWNTISWADGYKVRVNGGEWKAQTATVYTISSYGVYKVEVKGYDETAETEVATAEVIYTEDDISFTKMSNISFTNLNYEAGSVTFTTTGTQVRSASELALKKQYENQFMKITFTSVGTSSASNGIAIGLRVSQTGGDAGYTGCWNFAPYTFGGGIGLGVNYVDSNGAFNGFNNWISGESTYKPTNLVNNFNLLNGFVAGDTYTYLAGVLGSGKNASFYFGVYHGNELVRLTRWAWSGLEAQALAAGYASFPELRASGYLSIYNWVAENRTISYEIVEDATSILSAYDKPTVTASGNTFSWNTVGWAEGYKYSLDNGASWTTTTETTYSVTAYGAYNIQVKAYKGTSESAVATGSMIYSSTEVITGKVANISAYSEATDGTKSVTFTPDSTVATSGHQSQSTASFAENVKYGDAFLKVGFTATASCLMENYLNITIRSTYTTVPNPVFSGSYNFFVACFAANNMNVAPTVNNKQSGTTYQHWGSDHASLTVGNDYYMIAGIKTNADETKTLYFLVTEKQEDGTETLVKKMTWNFETVYATTQTEIADEGYFVVSSWLAGERTLTYKVITDATEMNAYINM